MSKCKIFVNVLCYRTILSKARALILSWFYGNISLMIMLYPEKQWLEEHEVGLQTVCFFTEEFAAFPILMTIDMVRKMISAVIDLLMVSLLS